MTKHTNAFYKITECRVPADSNIILRKKKYPYLLTVVVASSSLSLRYCRKSETTERQTVHSLQLSLSLAATVVHFAVPVFW